MNFFNRRDFLQSSAGLLAGLAATDLLAESSDAAQQNQGGANERINVACIGVRGQGRSHVSGYAGRHNCRVTHISDVDTAVVGPALTSAEKAQGVRPEYVQDLRRIMDNKNIHAVSIATPNHWHALAAIWAMQAGKHVYVEKPVSHNVREGRLMVEASRRFNKICQTGTQIRSQRGVQQAIEFLKSGKLGKVQIARGLCYKNRPSIGRVDADQAPPKTMDYDLWCGPASNRPPHRRTGNGTVHYDWHWIWEYGNGDLGNQGIHQVDVARWGLGKNQLANSVLSVGGRFGYIDDGETPNTQVSIFDYGDAQLIFEVRGLPSKDYRGARVGNVFHCSDGYLVFPSYSSAIAYDLKGEVLQRFSGGGDHFGNFIAAIRSGRRQDQAADIEEGHISSALCHLANISHRLGRPAPFNGKTSAFGDDRDAGETFQRMREHLGGANVPLDKTSYIVGRRLNVDVKTETFGKDEEANRMLTRNYRKGFEVPQKF